MSIKGSAAAVLRTCSIVALFPFWSPGRAAEVIQVDACALLTPAEVTQVIGLPVSSGVRRDQGLQPNGSYSSTCVWTINIDLEEPKNPRAPLGGRSFVILNAIQWPAGSGLARTFLEGFHAAAANGEIPSKPVPRKFGDEALWWGDGLAVRVEDVSFGLSVFMPKKKAPRPGHYEEQLAPRIVERLK
jgi:hypothetical protein